MVSKGLKTIYISGPNEEDLTTVTSLIKDRGWKRGNLPITKTGGSLNPHWVSDFVIEGNDLEAFTEAVKNSCLPLGLNYASIDGSSYFLLGGS